ncbi:MAG TPA: glycoside hydrolase family 16 protein, partial [Acidimicrobiales bacterium]|nr:glycoside hydrolase family 16 protein [Acidimicrobiales bacterium]
MWWRGSKGSHRRAPALACLCALGCACLGLLSAACGTSFPGEAAGGGHLRTGGAGGIPASSPGDAAGTLSATSTTVATSHAPAPSGTATGAISGVISSASGVHQTIAATPLHPPSVTPQPATVNDCGGQPLLQADGTTWVCTFDSEFTGTDYDHRQWQPVTTAKSGFTSGYTACFVDRPDNISVGNGYLSLTARMEPQPFVCQEPDPAQSFVTQETSGYLTTYQLFDQAYGRFEIDAKVPSTSVQGLQSSLWLYPTSLNPIAAVPQNGEIDIAEVYSNADQYAVPNLHYQYVGTNPATNTNTTTSHTCAIAVGKFNDYVVEWTPGTIEFIYNGTLCLVDHWVPAPPQSGDAPFDKPFFVNLTQAL